jgi:hypothetical protein
MAMKVEEFSTVELTSAGDVDSAEQVKALVEQLDLTGQKKFVSGESTETFCYRKMTLQEDAVYGAICPSRTKLVEYADSLMPLRVLQIAAHAKSLNVFDDLVVWHPENADMRDPVLVGVQKIKNQWGGTDDHLYLLVRWGTALKPFVECVEEARKIIAAKAKTELQDIVATATVKLAGLDAMIDSYVSTGRGKVSFFASL